MPDGSVPQQLECSKSCLNQLPSSSEIGAACISSSITKEFYSVGEKEDYSTRRKSVEQIECETHETSCLGSILPSGGIGASVYTLCAVSLGAGVFVLPAQLNLVGVVIGCFLIIVMGIVACLALLLLVRAATDMPRKEFELDRLIKLKQNSESNADLPNQQSPECSAAAATSDPEAAISIDQRISTLMQAPNECQTGLIHSYEDLCYDKLGIIGHNYMSITIAVVLFLGNCAHISFAASLLVQVMEYFFTGQVGYWETPWWKNALIYLFLMFMILPSCLQSTINSHKYISTLSVMTVIIIGAILVVEAFVRIGSGESAIGTSTAAPIVDLSTPIIFSVIPTISVIYSSCLTLFPVIREMKNPTYTSSKKAVSISQFMCAIVYCSVALCVAIAWGTSGASLALENIAWDQYWFTFLKFMLGIALVLLYPVLNLPMVYGINAAFFKGWPDTKWPNRQAVISLIGILLVALVCVAVPDLSSLFGLNGCIGLIPLNYVLPGIIALKSEYQLKYKIFSIVMIIVSVIVSISGSVFIFAHIAGKDINSW